VNDKGFIGLGIAIVLLNIVFYLAIIAGILLLVKWILL
jgi:hypothetical protein